MRSLLLFLTVVLATTYAQRLNLGVIETLSMDEIRGVMQNQQRVRFNVQCLLAKPVPEQCNKDPINAPLQNAVRAFASDRVICKSCRGDQRRKVGLILSQLQQNYTPEYNALSKRFGFS